jgi:hypothetical protein
VAVRSLGCVYSFHVLFWGLSLVSSCLSHCVYGLLWEPFYIILNHAALLLL